MLDWIMKAFVRDRKERLSCLEDINQCLQEAYKLHNVGSFAEAEKLYQRALDIDGDNAEALHLLGRLYGQTGKYENAIGSLEHAISLRSDFTDAMLDLGNVHRLRGDLEQAEGYYQRVLEQEPDNILACRNLGGLLKQTGNVDEAEQHLRKAIQLAPDFTNAREELVSLLFERKAFSEALGLLQNEIQRRPKDPFILYNIALVHNAQGEEMKAIDAFNKAIDLNPEYAEPYIGLSQLLFHKGEKKDAENVLRRLVDINPSSAEGYCHLGMHLFNQGKLDDAYLFLEKAIAQKYDYSLAYLYLALVQIKQSAYDDAMDNLQLAVYYTPDMAEAYLHMGMMLEKFEGYDEAIENFEKVLEHKAEDVQALCHLGISLHKQEKDDEALVWFNRVLEIEPEQPDTLNYIGKIFREQGNFELAEQSVRKVLESNPGFMTAYTTLACIYDDMGKFEDSVKVLDKALEIEPDFTQTRWNRALFLLKQGNFKDGWRDYEMRWYQTGETPDESGEMVQGRAFPFPVWDGRPAQSSTLLIYGEQGLGDEIMFASCIPDVLSMVKKVIIECDIRLVPLYQRSFPDAIVHGWLRKRLKGKLNEDFSWLESMGHIDAQIPVGSLPQYFRQDWSEFPQRKSYLKADPEKVHTWKDRMDNLGPGLKVGISWRGGTKKNQGLLRSMELKEWLPILKQDKAHFISLQYTDCANELSELEQSCGIKVHHWQEAIDDYDETAALVEALELVISVQTAIVHLSGAMGCPTWVMAPLCLSWRYLNAGERIPWYQSVRLFRQTTIKDWQPVIQRVANELETWPDSCRSE